MDQSNVSHVSMFLGTPDDHGRFTGFVSVNGDSGNIDGTLTGDNDVVSFIHWNFGHTGRYDGHRGADDQWSGVTIDLNDPSSQATWVAHREEDLSGRSAPVQMVRCRPTDAGAVGLKPNS